jgi:hypothetical protein
MVGGKDANLTVEKQSLDNRWRFVLIKTKQP